MSARREHPREGELRAWIDREVGPRRRLMVWMHLRRCSRCRARLARVRAAQGETSALLRALARPVDEAGAWARVAARAGHLRRGRGVHPVAALATAVPVCLLSVYLTREGDGAGTPHSAVEALARLQARSGAEITRDICCADHDGGGPADDGLFTLSLPGEAVAAVVVYEDLDGSGSFSEGDLPRYVSSRRAPPR